jgi:hypothetical protein
MPTDDAAAQGAPAAARPDDTAGAPSPVTVEARAEPASVTIGSRVRYVMEMAAPAGVEVVLAQPTERLGDFDIVDFGDGPPVTRDGRTVITRWYTLVGFTPGDHLLRSPPVRYRRPGEPLTAAPDREILVTVESLLARAGAAATDVRDIKPPEEPPIDWRPWYVAAAVLAALVALALVLGRVRGRARARQVAPPRPAFELALDELARLRARGLVEAGAMKEYYSALSTIVRTYLERRFAVRAPEMTTEEFLLTSARDTRLRGAHRALLAEFLTESDLVKFARHRPAPADGERAFAAATRFVEETAREPAAESARDAHGTGAPSRPASGPPTRPDRSGEESRRFGAAR